MRKKYEKGTSGDINGEDTPPDGWAEGNKTGRRRGSACPFGCKTPPKLLASDPILKLMIWWAQNRVRLSRDTRWWGSGGVRLPRVFYFRLTVYLYIAYRYIQSCTVLCAMNKIYISGYKYTWLPPCMISINCYSWLLGYSVRHQNAPCRSFNSAPFHTRKVSSEHEVIGPITWAIPRVMISLHSWCCMIKQMYQVLCAALLFTTGKCTHYSVTG